jgi:hypothetical protein
MPTARPRPSLEPKGNERRWLVPVAALGILLTGVLAIVLLGKRNAPVTVAPPAPVALAALSAPAAPSEPPLFANPSRVDPSDLYPKIKQRALAWNAEARLLSITASPVVGDKVDLSQDGAEIVYVFRTEMSARSNPLNYLSITARRGGIEQAPWADGPKPAAVKPAAGKPAAPADRTPATTAVGEPNCVFDAAAKAAHASGVPASSVMKLRYEGDPGLRRGVWTAKVAGHAELDRVMDGQSCAIVVRR